MVMPHKDPEARKKYRREYMREYREKHPEKGREASRKYREAHPEKIKEYQAEYLASGRMYEAVRRWRKKNPETYAAVGHRYRARFRNVIIEDTRLYRTILKQDPCSYCGKPSEEIDHIEPLIAGGFESEDNLTAACKSCNSRKKDRPLLTWMLDARSAS